MRAGASLMGMVQCDLGAISSTTLGFGPNCIKPRLMGEVRGGTKLVRPLLCTTSLAGTGPAQRWGTNEKQRL